MHNTANTKGVKPVKAKQDTVDVWLIISSDKTPGEREPRSESLEDSSNVGSCYVTRAATWVYMLSHMVVIIHLPQVMA